MGPPMERVLVAVLAVVSVCRSVAARPWAGTRPTVWGVDERKPNVIEFHKAAHCTMRAQRGDRLHMHYTTVLPFTDERPETALTLTLGSIDAIPHPTWTQLDLLTNMCVGDIRFLIVPFSTAEGLLTAMMYDVDLVQIERNYSDGRLATVHYPTRPRRVKQLDNDEICTNYASQYEAKYWSPFAVQYKVEEILSKYEMFYNNIWGLFKKLVGDEIKNGQRLCNRLCSWITAITQKYYSVKSPIIQPRILQ